MSSLIQVWDSYEFEFIFKLRGKGTNGCDWPPSGAVIGHRQGQSCQKFLDLWCITDTSSGRVDRTSTNDDGSERDWKPKNV